MAKANESDFRQAQALGHIKTAEETPAADAEKETGKEIGIDNPEDFRIAVGQAQMEGLEYVEVSERVFKFLAKNSTDKSYITYGEPGIRVYVKGTVDQVLAEEEMNAEAHGEMMAKRRSNDFVNKLNRR